jgi:hypothetical protein
MILLRHAVRGTAFTAAFLSLGAVAPVEIAPGISATLKMSMQPPMLGATVPATSLTGTVLMINGKARVELASSTGPALDFQSGDVMLLLDPTRAKYLRPGSQIFWDVDSPFTNPLAQTTQGAAISLSGLTTNLEKLGASDSVSGFATQRYRFTVDYSILFAGQPIPSRIATELYVAKLPVKFSSAAIGTLQGINLLQSKELNDKVAALYAELAAEGVIVYSTTTTTFTVQGNAITMSQTAELTDIKPAEVDEAKLVMPTGYRPGG